MCFRFAMALCILNPDMSCNMVWVSAWTGGISWWIPKPPSSHNACLSKQSVVAQQVCACKMSPTPSTYIQSCPDVRLVQAFHLWILWATFNWAFKCFPPCVNHTCRQLPRQDVWLCYQVCVYFRFVGIYCKHLKMCQWDYTHTPLHNPPSQHFEGTLHWSALKVSETDLAADCWIE